MSNRILELENILKEFFELPELNLRRTMQAKDIEGWDSLAHLDLMAKLEEDYSIKFSLAEITGLNNVGELADLIDKKINNR
ncbi:MAG: acyl carrier protein [bacterium]|nr:acyl carrier protein [bacterium]